MTTNKIKQALIFAAAIVITAFLMRGHENADSMIMMIIALWVAGGGFATGDERPLNCLKRRFAGK